MDGFPDLAEEVIREYGYDHIVPTFLNTAAVTNGGLNYEQKQQLKTKRLLAAQGFYEASTLAFYSNAELDMLHIPEDDVARKAIRILNPISENLSIMRTLLTPSMLNVIVDNLKKGNNECRLFEMAPVYLAKELPINEHPHERQTLCIGAFGPEEDFFTVKGAMEALAAGFGLSFEYKRESTPWLHPGISAAVYCNGKRLGVFGKLSNEINGELEIAKEQKDSQNIYLGAEPHETAEENRKTELDGEVPEAGFTARMYRKNPRRMQIYQALDLPYREVPLDEAVGKMAADYVYLYPPGIPLIVPGEVITEEFIRHIRECRERKLNVEGQGNLALGRIKIVYF